jgi:hypothetical protein
VSYAVLLLVFLCRLFFRLWFGHRTGIVRAHPRAFRHVITSFQGEFVLRPQLSQLFIDQILGNFPLTCSLNLAALRLLQIIQTFPRIPKRFQETILEVFMTFVPLAVKTKSLTHEASLKKEQKRVLVHSLVDSFLVWLSFRRNQQKSAQEILRSTNMTLIMLIFSLLF